MRGRGLPRLSVTWYASRRSFIRKPMTSTKSSTSRKSSLALGPIWGQVGWGQGAMRTEGSRPAQDAKPRS